MEPPVSEPKENSTSPAATDAAEPPEEPPGTVSKIPWITCCFEMLSFHLKNPSQTHPYLISNCNRFCLL